LKRLLITGGSGLLALNWACCMREDCEIHLGTHLHRVNLAGTRSMRLDMDSSEALAAQLARLQPGIIVHTAGMTSVDRCEQQPDAALYANAVLARQVALAARVQSIRLIHISTDHLFSGDRPLVSEEAVPEPLNVYARTKLQAEQWVQQANPDALIVRTNFFGWGHARRQSFSDWIIASLRSGQSVTMFDDVYFTPILADTLAKAAHALVAVNAGGIFNVVGDERISKYEFGRRVARRFGLDETLIRRGKIAGAQLSASRPHDMSLDNRKIKTLLNAGLGDVDGFLDELYRQERLGRPGEFKTAVVEQ